MAKKQRSKVEGEAIKQISVKLTSARLKKLEEIMEKIGVKDVQDGFTSENMRSCIDKLHYHIVIHRSQTAIVNPSQIKPKFLTKPHQNPDTRMCPMAEEEVIISILCNKICRERTPETWRKCPAR